MSGVIKDYYGVKGWLLLLCLSLAILDPLAGFFNLMAIVEVMQPHFATDKGLFRMVLVGGTCNICLIVYSMYTGISLWKMWPNATVNAKRYLLILFHYSFISIFFPQLFGLSEKTINEIYNVNPLHNAMVMFYACVWYLYIRKSKRVQTTYPENGHIVS